MTWFKVDDRFHSHEGVVEAGLRAVGLWTVAGSWCSQQERDGYVPSSMVTRLGGRQVDATALVRAGLWIPVDGGYQFDNWAKYNPLKSQLEANREKDRIKKAKGRCRNHHGETCWDNAREVCGKSEGVPRGQTQGSPSESACPDPTRPDPLTTTACVRLPAEPHKSQNPATAGSSNVDLRDGVRA